MTAEASVEALIAADDVSLQFHLCGPAEAEAVYAGLIERRARLVVRWNQARAAGNWPLADRVVMDLLDLNHVTAAAAEAIADQRRRFRYPELQGISVLYLGDW